MAPRNAPHHDLFSALRACRLWRIADDEAVVALADSADVQEVPRGTVLAAEGDLAERFGVVIAGRVRVFHLGADGRMLTFETVGAGEPVAAIAALAGSRHPANIEASTPVTIAWLPTEALYDLLERRPAVARGMIAGLARRVVDFTAVATSLAMDVPSRLASYLFQRSLAVGRATPSGLLVDLGMSKTDLASALGTVPETLSRAFARLRADGILEVRSRDVIVKDVGALARMGSGYSEG